MLTQDLILIGVLLIGVGVFETIWGISSLLVPLGILVPSQSWKRKLWPSKKPSLVLLICILSMLFSRVILKIRFKPFVLMLMVSLSLVLLLRLFVVYWIIFPTLR